MTRNNIYVWAMVLGRRGREFVAHAQHDLMATCRTKKDLRGWMKTEGYDDRIKWPNVRVMKLVAKL